MQLHFSRLKSNGALVLFVISSVLILSAPNDIHAQQNESAIKKPTRVELNSHTWVSLLEGEWLFKLYAPWCPACYKLESEWQKLVQLSSMGANHGRQLNVAAADVTENPDLTGRFLVRGLPKIYHVKDGLFRLYQGPLEFQALRSFIEEEQWNSLEPVSRWLAPDTFQMSLLAYSFDALASSQDIHNYLVGQIGLPRFLSYFLFAMCALTFGAVGAFIVVSIVDILCLARLRVMPTSQNKIANNKQAAGAARGPKERNNIDLDDSPPSAKDALPQANTSARQRQRQQ